MDVDINDFYKVTHEKGRTPVRKAICDRVFGDEVEEEEEDEEEPEEKEEGPSGESTSIIPQEANNSIGISQRCIWGSHCVGFSWFLSRNALRGYLRKLSPETFPVAGKII